MVFDDHSIAEGAWTTIAGTAVYVDSDSVLVGEKTYALPLPTYQAVAFASNGKIVFDGATLEKGAQATISGTDDSVGDDIVVVGGKTYALPTDSSYYHQTGSRSMTARLGAVITSMFDYQPSAASPDQAGVSARPPGSSAPEGSGAHIWPTSSMRIGAIVLALVLFGMS